MPSAEVEYNVRLRLKEPEPGVSLKSITGQLAGELVFGLMGAMLALGVSYPCAAQKPADSSSQMHEMLVTQEGFLAIDTPKGWVRSDGPGLAFFLPEGVDRKNTEVWIYINCAPVGPHEEAKDMDSYIQSDISDFKQHFKNATVRKEEALFLPEVKQQAVVYTIESGEEDNAFEQVIYIRNVGRVLIFDMTAKNSDALKRTVQLFHEFAKSYRGSIQMDSPGEKP